MEIVVACRAKSHILCTNGGEDLEGQFRTVVQIRVRSKQARSKSDRVRERRIESLVTVILGLQEA